MTRDEFLAGRGLDDSGGLVRASGGQIPAVGAEGEGVNSAPVHDPEEALCRCVVSTTRAVLSWLPVARYRPSGLKATAKHFLLVRDPDKLLAGRGLDDPGSLVVASGPQIPAVGAEGDGENSVLVRDPEELLAGRGLDDPGDAVFDDRLRWRDTGRRG